MLASPCTKPISLSESLTHSTAAQKAVIITLFQLKLTSFLTVSSSPCLANLSCAQNSTANRSYMLQVPQRSMAIILLYYMYFTTANVMIDRNESNRIEFNDSMQVRWERKKHVNPQ